jgi:hypothetical protein
MLPVGFELTISADERPQTYAFDRAATGTGTLNVEYNILISISDSKTINYYYKNL